MRTRRFPHPPPYCDSSPTQKYGTCYITFYSFFHRHRRHLHYTDDVVFVVMIPTQKYNPPLLALLGWNDRRHLPCLLPCLVSWCDIYCTAVFLWFAWRKTTPDDGRCGGLEKLLESNENRATKNDSHYDAVWRCMPLPPGVHCSRHPARSTVSLWMMDAEEVQCNGCAKKGKL